MPVSETRPAWLVRTYVNGEAGEVLVDLRVVSQDTAPQAAAATAVDVLLYVKARTVRHVVCPLPDGLSFDSVQSEDGRVETTVSADDPLAGLNDAERALVLAASDEAVPAAELAEKAGLPAKGAGSKLAALERKGLVESVPDDAARLKLWRRA